MSGPVAFVGDAHLVAADETTGLFAAFLEQAPERFERLVIVGDLFDLWLARPHLHEAHHARVLSAIAGARDRGLAVDYTVGNRDFGLEHLRPCPFDHVASEVLAGPEVDGHPAWLAEHGDLVNDDDRAYRRWRAFSRSPAVLGSFLRLPGTVGIPLAQWLERRMRTTNLAYKRRFPTEHVVRHAARHFDRTGSRYLVLGHFHEERRVAVPGGEVLVLPDWKRSRRHLEWSLRGTTPDARFVASLT